MVLDRDWVVVTPWNSRRAPRRARSHGHDDVLVLLSEAQPYFRPEGMEHDGVNGSEEPFAFLENEIEPQG